MPRRLLFALLVLVAAPLALLGWLSASAYREQQKSAREQLELIFQTRLAEIDRTLAYVVDGYARDLELAVVVSEDRLQTLRQLDYRNPIVRASFLINDSGMLMYPPKPTSDSPEQIALYASLPAIVASRPDVAQRGMLDDGPKLLTTGDEEYPEDPPDESLPGKSEDVLSSKSGGVQSTKVKSSPSKGMPSKPLPTKSLPTKSLPSKSLPSKSLPTKSSGTKSAYAKSAPAKSAPSKLSSGRSGTADTAAFTSLAPARSASGQWQIWYMDEGIQLIYWVRGEDGSAVGILLERARWVADLSAVLPDSTPLNASTGPAAQASGFTALTDEARRIVYRWGDASARVNPPLATYRMSPPLSSWRLEYHSADPLQGSASTPLIASLAGIGVVLLSLGAYVLTGVQRQMRAARNRVSFASQVSHELRTPLTNIRLYAELAESDLEKIPQGESRASIERRLEVIDTESRRLGRLVSGVLEMIRDSRKQQGPRIASVIPDEVIEQTLTQFEPSFERADLSVVRELEAGRVVGVDADILEMILVNLLSNVEKYACEGKSVRVSSRMDGAELVVRVADDGPGIAWRHRRSIFRPFSRLDDSISAPSGTGIGLTIARRLARRHGGGLELVSSSSGACFEIRLPTETVDQESSDRPMHSSVANDQKGNGGP